MKKIVPLIACTVALGQAVAEENWPAFRGPEARGVSANPHLPLEWSDTKNVEWKAAIPGLGWSGPVVQVDSTVCLSPDP